MKILLAYHHKEWNKIGFFHEKYYTACGHEVTSMPLEQTPYWSDWYNRIPFYIPKGWPVSVKSLERKYGKKFDLMVEIDSTGQYHLSGLGKAELPSVLWSLDTHVKAKQRFQKHIQKDFDLIFTCHKDYTGVFDKSDCRWLPVASDPDFHRDMRMPKIYDVAFVGNADPRVYPERVRLLEVLAKKFKVNVFNKVFGEEMVRILNQAKIIFNKSFNGDLNMRVFETLSCGTLLVTERIKNGLPDLFEDGKHLVMYDNDSELEDRVAYYLKHEDERERVARTGQKEVREKHTYYHRAKTILEFVENRLKI